MTINAYGERLVNPMHPPSYSPDCALQLYDICIAKDSPYFVVTNYYGWVFGVFSRGM